jgi:hypothetical protein
MATNMETAGRASPSSPVRFSSSGKEYTDNEVRQLVAALEELQLAN